MNPIFFAMVMKWLRGGFVVALALAILPAEASAARSQAQKRLFAATHLCPNGKHLGLPCAGHVVDHIAPLACGGPDLASNMQYQTIAAGKLKDTWERKNCKGGKRITLGAKA